MNRGIISTRYAKALLNFALEKGVEEDVYGNIVCLSQSFREVPELESTLLSPAISTKEKQSLILTASGKITSDEFKRFINLVINHEREGLLKSMCIVYIHLHNKHHNISICDLVTAVPVSQDVEDRIKSIVSHRTHGPVILEKRVDPEIIGGFVFEIDYNRLDASIRTQLNQMRRELSEIKNL